MTPQMQALVPSWYVPKRLFAERETVLRKAARLTGRKIAELRGPSRIPELCRIRWAAMEVMREQGLSLPQIGRAIGGRDHTTVIHGLSRAEELLAVDEQFASLVAMLRCA